MTFNDELERIATLRAHGLACGWTCERTAEEIVARFDVTPLKAQRLARGWTRPRAVEEILLTYDREGLRRPSLTPQRLCAWEHEKSHPGEEYLDRLCRLYESRPDKLGFGRDYAPDPPEADHPESATPIVGSSPVELDAKEVATDRNQFLRAAGVTGLATLLEQTGLASMRLSRKSEESNVGPITLDQLELRVANLRQRFQHTPDAQLVGPASTLREEVETLLDGKQPLTQRSALHRIAGQLSAFLGETSFDLSDFPSAYSHLLTAEQLAREVGDHDLLAAIRVRQSTVALWDGDYRMALHYARDGQRYATDGATYAQLAGRGEARACARLGDRAGVFEALGRAERALPSDQSGDGWTAFSPGALELYTGISLLWLGSPEQAEPHVRQAISLYEAAPVLFQSPANHAQAEINLAICMVNQGQPEEGLRLATEALKVDRGHVEPNLQQAQDLLAALDPRHRDLPAARDFADHLHSIRDA